MNGNNEQDVRDQIEIGPTDASLTRGAIYSGLAGRAGQILTRATQLLKGARLRERQPPRLALVERITLAPRQTLALVEAEGRRLLVAISADGSPAFLALDAEQGAQQRNPRSGNSLPARPSGTRNTASTSGSRNAATRVSW